ncbi:hypothetical protein NE236_19800 [Actinoallomurus purpureus]|uniref:hypothetical protein n=1 Tax=Actinoallomurus purpureus TaxID=478114 RepID=UPI00209386EC|nr:hypothetical protein [Actinoallomurus purpureus]MCO6007228.1 hypothetical protein [Actinoallomurus purpureus]
MRAVIRAAIATGAIAAIAGLTVPAASATTSGPSKPPPVPGNHCQWTKPKVCSTQWTRIVSKNKRVRMFKGYAGIRVKGKSSVRGRIGVAFSNPRGGKTVIHWKKGYVTLVNGGKVAESGAWTCPTGDYAQTVWHTAGGSNWYSNVDRCGS